MILYCALKDVDKGFYIDVGANDPTKDSVTKFFYDRGWHGINIEPLSDKCALLAEKRPRDINLCIGLGNERGKLDIFPHGGLTTFSEKIAKSVKTPTNSKYLKSVLTLSEVYDKYPPPTAIYTFAKLTWKVLNGKSLKAWKIGASSARGFSQ